MIKLQEILQKKILVEARDLKINNVDLLLNLHSVDLYSVHFQFIPKTILSDEEKTELVPVLTKLLKEKLQIPAKFDSKSHGAGLNFKADLKIDIANHFYNELK